ncbi:M56 family metallopeptidase, partial [Acinetobacter baumannii]
MLIRLAAGLVYGARLVRASTPIDPGVRESKAVTVPVTIGILKPAILLPGDWRAWAPARLQAVLAHERSHVQRRDPLRQFAT